MAEHPSQSTSFRQVYETYSDAMREYCFRRLPISDVNDAVAEVFVAVWRKIDDMPAGVERKLWLYGIARNVTRNAHRSARRRQRLNGKVTSMPIEHEPGPEAIVVRHHEHEALLEALSALRPADQEILRLHTWEELSSAQIAEVMDLTVRAVDTRLSRARQKLARKVGASHPTRRARRPNPIQRGGVQ